MAGPGVTIANSNPQVPDGEFWNHPRHIEPARYGGVYTNTFDPLYQSVISADTKFWYRGAGSPKVKTFVELSSGIKPDTNFSDGTINIPGVGCTTHSVHTKRIYDVSINYDEVDSINFLKPSQDDAYFIWTEYPDATRTSSRFYYINGVLTKVGINYDWTEFTTESNVGYMLTSKPQSSSVKVGMTCTTGSLGVGLWATGSDATEGFAQGLNRTFDFWLTASKAGTGIIDITTSFGNLQTEYGATEQLYNLFIGSIQTGSTPRFVSTPPGGFTQQIYYSSSLFSGVQGWDITSSNGEVTFYHDSDTQNKVMWQGSTLKDEGSGKITYGDTEITGSGIFLDTVDMRDSRYHTSIEMISTPTHVYHTYSIGKAEEFVKFKDSQTHKVKKPTCECINILRWFNVPYQMPTAICGTEPLYYYRLTFNDGYQFTCGGLLRLITFNPLFTSATQSMGVNYPNSGQWPHSLQLRTAVELFDNSADFVNNSSAGFVKCNDLVPGTTKTSGYLTLTNIERIQFEPNVTDLRNYYWNENLNEKHFDINATAACPTSSTTKHEFFPHMVHVETDMSSFTNPSYHSHINGVVMIENGLYVVFEKYKPLRITVDTHSNIACVGQTNGSLDISVAGGTAPYEYSWSNGATTQDITNLSAGIYDVQVTDANGYFNKLCGLEITQPSGVELSIASLDLTHVTCNGLSNGAIDMTVVGGTTPYTYSWTGPGGPYTTQDLSDVAGGTYNVTVTDNNGCTATGTAVINEPAALTITSILRKPQLPPGTPPTALEPALEDMPYWRENVAVSVSAAGGTLPYTYSWEHGYDEGGPTPQAFEPLCTESWAQFNAANPSFTGKGGEFPDANLSSCNTTAINNYPRNDKWAGSSNDYATTTMVEGLGVQTSQEEMAIRVTVTDANGCTAQVTQYWTTGGGSENVFGCTSSNATNYNFYANIDNGTCTF